MIDYQNVNPTLELDEAEMKRIGYEAVDMMVAHFASLSKQAPVRKADNIAMDLLLQESLPEKGSNPSGILQHVRDNIFANSALTTHPRFYSFVPSPSNFISAIADGLASAYNLFSGAWVSSPGAAKLEMVTINWILKLFGFPVREGGGLFVSGGSAANLLGLSVARNVKLGNDIANAMIYFSDQTHSSVERALLVLGFHQEQIKRIPCDEQFQLPVPLYGKSFKRISRRVNDRSAWWPTPARLIPELSIHYPISLFFAGNLSYGCMWTLLMAGEPYFVSRDV